MSPASFSKLILGAELGAAGVWLSGSGRGSLARLNTRGAHVPGANLLTVRCQPLAHGV
jgi:hypothetical protein